MIAEKFRANLLLATTVTSFIPQFVECFNRPGMRRDRHVMVDFCYCSRPSIILYEAEVVKNKQSHKDLYISVTPCQG